MARMAEHREGEQAAVEDFLRGRTPSRGSNPARLTGAMYCISKIRRTSDCPRAQTQAGVRSLSAFLAPLAGGSCRFPSTAACTSNPSRRIWATVRLGCAQPVRLNAFEVEEIIFTADDEAHAANCLRIHDHLLVLAGFPQTQGRLEAFARRHDLRVTALMLPSLPKATDR